jgi:hypothetical protein
MNEHLDWPALRLEGPLPHSLHYERGVWGKVHGAPTDFRWIARSPGFARDCPDLARQLNLGGEDVLSRFPCWRSLGDRCYAVSVYPSRAIDASSRRDFLEKLVIEWRPPAGVPAAIGALLLLPLAAGFTDEIWWGRFPAELAYDPAMVMQISPAEVQPLPIDHDRLCEAVTRSRRALLETVKPVDLERLYDQLRAGCRPAFLPGLQQPLPAEALAALLLPLSRDVADRTSLTGWIPTSRPSFADLAARWDILVGAPDQAVPSPTSQIAIAPAVLPPPPIASAADTPPRPGARLALTPPEPGARVIDRLYQFARDPGRRWLTPDDLKVSESLPRLSPRDHAAGIVCGWVREVCDRRPGWAHPKQWEVKTDLLRSAALVIVPDASTLDAIGRPAEDGRVPLLFFALALERRSERERLAAIGETSLRQVLHQSLTCRGPKAWMNKLREWLRLWQQEAHRDVKDLIADALASCRPSI